MHHHTLKLFSLLALASLAITSCGGDGREAALEPPSTDARAGIKIPVTTRSDEALDLYLQGLSMSDRIRPVEARELYLLALQEDRHFAMAHLRLATSSTSAREFFEAMERAIALSEVVSEGERLMILAQDAAVRGEAGEQLELLQRLVELYPDDERAQLALAVVYNARQDYERAIEHYRRAIDIEPDFSPVYNQLGYLYRALGRYQEAEDAFLKYIQLIPDEPNPYDSYAELLMKVGRFEESIEAYEKALTIKPDFLFSLVGIGHDLIFLGRAEEARETFDHMYELAPDVGQQRVALLWKSMSYVYEHDWERALAIAGDRYALAEANDDPVGMSGDRILMGMILLAAEEPGRALERFIDAVTLVGNAGVPEEFKETTQRNFLYWKTRVELDKGNLGGARSELDSYREQVELRQNPGELRLVHQLEAEIALADGDPRKALQHLSQANQQDPRILYLTARAHQAAGDVNQARELATRAAAFNELAIGTALVKGPAEDLQNELDGVPAD
jgi:tetratricopeptide (TPR) repeat protein